MTANSADRLLKHYVDKYRPLPWRSPPGGVAPDPYRVWLSEVMLQQTTVAAVTPRFMRFVGRWPTVEALAAVSDEEVLSEWAGLGYYARARNLIACAREVVRRRGFPKKEAELRTLPGIGAYTAAAIAAIAFGERSAAVDTNVMRVIARLQGLEQPSRAEVAELVSAMMPDHPGDFAQALMDLGATICRPRSPDCPACPWASECVARLSGSPELYPAPKVPRMRPTKHGIALWVERDGHVWLVRRPARGLLGGMAALPGPGWTAAEPPLPGLPLARLRHDFTHFALELSIVAAPAADGDGWWQPLESIASAGLPTLYRRAVELVLEGRASSRAAA